MVVERTPNSKSLSAMVRRYLEGVELTCSQDDMVGIVKEKLAREKKQGRYVDRQINSAVCNYRVKARREAAFDSGRKNDLTMDDLEAAADLAEVRGGLDALLSEVEDIQRASEQFRGFYHMVRALRALSELRKPRKPRGDGDDTGGKKS